MARRPDKIAILVGAMKAGTSSLFRYASDHAAICPAQPSEPDFFSHEWDHDLSWYFDHFDWQDGKHEWAFEKSTSYTRRPYDANPIPRIRRIQERTGAEFRFLYLLRDPVHRIESHAKFEASSEWGYDDPGDVEGIPGRWLAPSMYAQQIQPYMDAFGEDKILLLNFEDLKEQPRALVERVFDFLDLEPADELESVGRQYNASDGQTKKSTVLQLLEEMGVAQAASSVLPDSVRSRLRETLHRSVDTTDLELSEEQREFFQQVLKAELQKLHEQHEIDVTRWPNTPPTLER